MLLGGLAAINSWGGFFSALGKGLLTKAAIWGGAAGGFASGFSGSLLNGGSIGDAFKAGIIGAATGAATAWAAGQIGSFFNGLEGAWADEMFSNWAGRTVAHGAVGGLVAEAQGGSFRHGFYSSAAAAGVMHIRGVGRFFNSEKGGGWIAARTAAAATIGGTASALAGGKFANGAVTSAFQHLFNQEATRRESRRLIPSQGATIDDAWEVRVEARSFAIDQASHTYVAVENTITGQRYTLSGFGMKDSEGNNRLMVLLNDPKDRNNVPTAGDSVLIATPTGVSRVDFANRVMRTGFSLSKVLGQHTDYVLLGNKNSVYLGGNCHNVSRAIITGSGGAIPASFDPRGKQWGLGNP